MVALGLESLFALGFHRCFFSDNRLGLCCRAFNLAGALTRCSLNLVLSGGNRFNRAFAFHGNGDSRALIRHDR